MSGTTIFYNSVLMRDCELLEFEQVIERDKSGTDPLFSRFRITVASTLVSLLSTNPEEPPPSSASGSIDHLSTIGIPDGVNTSGVTATAWVIPDRIAIIQQKLQEFRGDFWLAIHGVTYKPESDPQQAPVGNSVDHESFRIVLAATGLDYLENESTGKLSAFYAGKDTDIDRRDIVDTDNGPKVSNVRIVRIDGGRAMRIQASFEICRCICANNTDLSTPPVRDASKVEGIISNKWSVTDAIDEKWITAHRIEGELLVASKIWKPHAMRMMVTPALFPYAKLESREFATDPTGLVLRYSFSIREAGYAPPPGIVDWGGSYVESTSIGNSQRVGSLSVQIQGTNQLPAGWTWHDRRDSMLIALHDIARSRINGLNVLFANPDPRAKAVLQRVAIAETLGKPEMSLQATVLWVDAEINQFRLRLDQMGEPMVIPQYDPRWWPVPGDFQWGFHDDDPMNLGIPERGSYFDCYFQSPCSEWHSMPRGFDKPTIIADNRSDPLPTQFKASTVPYGDIDYSIGLSPLPMVAGIHHGWSDDQLSAATYISFDADDHYEVDRGAMHLPLSKPRVRQISTITGYKTIEETSVCVPVHAGISRRTFTMVATRFNQPPEVPSPTVSLANDPSGIVETLTMQDIVTLSPELQADGVTLLHGIKVEWSYAMSRMLGSGAGSRYDALRVPSSPKDLTTPALTRLALASIFTENRIEEV